MGSRLFLVGLVALTLTICSAGTSQAQSEDESRSLWNRDELTGNWNGVRSRLDDNGLAVEVNLIGDVMGNVAGGVEPGLAVIDNIDFKLLIDPEPLIGWKESNLLISGLQNNGGSISQYAGDVQGVSNIEAERTVRLFEAWVQQNFWSHRISVLGGLYDVNSEFDFSESGALFIQSSQGMGGDFAGSGLIGPPTFPAAGLGGRIKIVPARSLYFQAGVFDGTPGKLSSAAHADFEWNASGGSLGIAELGLLSFGSETFHPGDDLSTRQDRSHIGREVASDYRTKIAFGVWSYSRNYVKRRYDISMPGVTDHQNDRGAYILTDWKWNPNPDRPDQELSIFGRIGVTENDVSRFKSYAGGGITYVGLIPGDPEGSLGFSIASTQNSKLFQQIHPTADDYEIVLEWTYLTRVISWLNLQPDLQYVISPGAAPNRDNAWVLGLRTDIAL